MEHAVQASLRKAVSTPWDSANHVPKDERPDANCLKRSLIIRVRTDACAFDESIVEAIRLTFGVLLALRKPLSQSFFHQTFTASRNLSPASQDRTRPLRAVLRNERVTAHDSASFLIGFLRDAFERKLISNKGLSDIP